MGDEYYKDGLTKITDPFYAFECRDGHLMWSVTYMEKCPKCGAPAKCCIPANKYKKEAASGN